MRPSDEAKKVHAMSRNELLDYVIQNPHHLTDSYYLEIGQAIRDRKVELDTFADLQPTYCSYYI